ncbi:DUF4037 domain-containing protein [Streptomyces hoynatensis]|uniref:DUF4037 domain-containing protein n=1 Tax=Streptomyces hoynatensis TaxID=1141874 RepID=A0A3A9YV95_9ACTN|nr:DUF4037 domain-containing protein [Streptomyces hoynatensis]RKN39860.1 DUF4037 domain-containing protein [Streptomyces hoynatensis]
MSHEPEAAFLPGLRLSRVLYEEAVRPLLAAEFPRLRYAAARVGTGSEVLGFDTARSADHEWGPRLNLFLSAADAAALGPRIRALLAERLPKEVRGWPTHFTDTRDPLDPVGRMEPTEGPVSHRVSVADVGSWLRENLGLTGEPATADWLAMPQQRLAEATAGEVFHDGLGELTAARRRLAWYPDQVWRYLLACQWQRLSQEEAFPGRCAEVGDDLGAAVLAGRLVRDLMRLCLLLSRTYAPYGKWLGSAFARLPVAATLTPVLRGALAATGQAMRERRLCEAYEAVAALQNESGLTAPVDPARRPYYGRPFLVLHAERFAKALADTLTDPRLRALPLTGGVDQWADNTDFLGNHGLIRAAVAALPGA